MKSKSKLMFLGIMLAFILAVSFTLTPTASAATNFTVVGFITAIQDDPMSASSASKITFPHKNSKYLPFYLLPRNTDKQKVAFPSFTVLLKANNAQFLDKKLQVYNDTNTATKIPFTISQSGYDVTVTIPVATIASRYVNGAVTYYNFTIGDTSNGQKVIFTVKTEA